LCADQSDNEGEQDIHSGGVWRLSGWLWISNQKSQVFIEMFCLN